MYIYSSLRDSSVAFDPQEHSLLTPKAVLISQRQLLQLEMRHGMDE